MAQRDVAEHHEIGNDVQCRRDGVKLAYVLYLDSTALVMISPYEVIGRRPDAETAASCGTEVPPKSDGG